MLRPDSVVAELQSYRDSTLVKPDRYCGLKEFPGASSDESCERLQLPTNNPQTPKYTLQREVLKVCLACILPVGLALLCFPCLAVVGPLYVPVAVGKSLTISYAAVDNTIKVLHQPLSF